MILRHSDEEHCRKKSSWDPPTFCLLNFFKSLDKFQLSLLSLGSHGLRKIPESLGIRQVQCLEDRCTAGINSLRRVCALGETSGATLFSFMVLFIGLLSFGLTPSGD